MGVLNTYYKYNLQESFIHNINTEENVKNDIDDTISIFTEEKIQKFLNDSKVRKCLPQTPRGHCYLPFYNSWIKIPQTNKFRGLFNRWVIWTENPMGEDLFGEEICFKSKLYGFEKTLKKYELGYITVYDYNPQTLELVFYTKDSFRKDFPKIEPQSLVCGHFITPEIKKDILLKTTRLIRRIQQKFPGKFDVI